MGYISLWGRDFAASKGCSMYKVSSQSHIVNAIIKVDHFRQLKTNTFLSFIILIIKKVLQYTRWGCNIKMTVIMDNKHLC